MITKKDIKDLSDGVITPQTKLLIIAADFALEGDQHTELITGLKKNDIEYLQFIGLSEQSMGVGLMDLSLVIMKSINCYLL